MVKPCGNYIIRTVYIIPYIYTKSNTKITGYLRAKAKQTTQGEIK